MNCYAVEVTEKIGRTAYVRAATAADARKLARDTSNWTDATDPENVPDSVAVKGVRLDPEMSA